MGISEDTPNYGGGTIGYEFVEWEEGNNTSPHMVEDTDLHHK
jgi:hypothetical protein